ncbi:MAG: KpsF/GutQ family sugar-phosphate isomerase [Alphaproteobacteria bacterium]|nr:KpsF/GutQ family sugar-phosphate isomerase [Alphaproteobacteria bacterium]
MKNEDALTAVEICAQVLNTELNGLKILEESLHTYLRQPIEDAANLMLNTSGRVIVSGMGKSGHIGRKIAATLASTGQPALFVHPGEASHGDLGMLTSQDMLILLSNSGETKELHDIMHYAVRYKIPFIGITGKKNSALDRLSTVSLLMPDVPEACPMGLAPTTSTTLMMALCDALAITLLTWRGFTNHDFKQFHPGGKLGAQLTKVSDIMHTNPLPIVKVGTLMGECLIAMTSGGYGCVGVVGDDGSLKGIVTDGDLRRHMADDLLAKSVESVMTVSPKTIEQSGLMAQALHIMETFAITSLFVVEAQKPVGIVHIHDCIRLGVV